MNELEQLVSILKEISSTIESVNPAISSLTEGLSSMVERFSASESGIKSMIEALNIYIGLISRLNAGKSPVLKISDNYIKQLNDIVTALRLISTEEISPKIDTSPITKLTKQLEESENAADVLEKALDAIDKKLRRTPDVKKREEIKSGKVIETPTISLDVYGEQLEKEFSGILQRLKKKYNISEILEEPRKLPGGIYRVVANQIREEGEEAKRVSFYIDKLGNAHSKLAYASRVTQEDIDALISKYSKLEGVLKELGMTQENILNISHRPDIGEGVVSVEVGDEKRNFKKSVLLDTEGRVGFTKKELLGQYTEKQFNEILSKFPELESFVKQHNLSVENLKNAYHNAAAGVYEFKFAVADADGIVRKLNIRLDEQGKLLLSSKDRIKAQTQTLLEQIKSQFPSVGEQLKDVFGNTEDVNITKLNSGIYRVSGYKQVGDAIEKIIVYVDRLGNVHEKLSEASKVTRDEINKLASEFSHIETEVKKYGYSLENITNIERTAGGVVKITLSDSDIGNLTLYADNLGRVATTLRGLGKQLPSDVIKTLTDRFKDLNKELEKYGASVRDISGLRKLGNITEISFTAKDKDTGIPYTRKVYGDARGRVFSDARLASQMTEEDLTKVSVAYENAINAAKKYGATLENLIRIIHDEKTNISQLVFAIEDANGAVKQFSIFTDQAGRVGTSKQDLGGRGFSTEELEKAKQAYSPVIKLAEKYGYTLTDLKKIHTEASTGITRLTFAMKGAANETRVLTLSVDKYGNVLKDVQRKYQGFLDGIARNIVEATKWAVAIQLTYAPLQKLNELIDTSIDNQSKLADIAIGLNLSLKRVSGVFRDVAAVADDTATPLNEALEGFSAAYRATAGLGNQSERTAVALKLLRTSLVLSKLAAIDQSEAIDILVGALRQANIPLSESERILDKWIAVSKNAQVGINDLAEAYSVVGSAAINSGFDIDKLNGIIATLVESTPYSGKEVGNILRTFISNIQTSEAERQLNEIGIAVKDLNGEFRDFSEILDEISAKYSAGIIDDTKLKELARNLAGGSRRAAPFITMITQYGKALRTAEISNKAYGESQKALDIKLKTAKSSIISLANSFQTLAETVGDSGGILDLFSVLVDTLDKMVGLMDSFVSSTGKAGVMLMTLTPLLGYLNRTGRIGALTAPINTFLGNKFGYSGRIYTSSGWQQVPKYKLSPEMATLGITGMAILGSAAYDYATGNRNEKEAATGRVVGATAGGVLATILGAPMLAPITASIGSMIGEAFVNKVNQDGAESIAETIAHFTMKNYEDNTKLEKSDKVKTSKEDEFFDSFFLRALGWIAQKEVSVLPESFVGKETKEMWGENYRYGMLVAAANGAPLIGSEKQQLAIDILKTATVESREFIPQDVKLENPTEPIEIQAAVANKNLSEDFTGITSGWEEKISAEFNRGRISAAEYEKELERISNLSSNLPSIYVNLGEALTSVGYKTSTAVEGLSKLSEIYIKGTDDEKEKIATLLTELNKVNNEILKLQQQGIQVPVELVTKKENLTNQFIDYANNILQNIHVRNFRPPTVIKEKEATEEDARRIYERAKQKMQAWGDELIKAGAMTADEFQTFLKNLEDMFVEFNSGMLRTQGIQRWAWDSAKEELLNEGKLSSTLSRTKEAGFRIQSVDFTSARAGEFQSLVAYFTEYLKTNFPNYKLKEQDVGIIYQDYRTDILHADNLAIQMALNKMVELNQKQLDGIYNLPSNATFWVPYQAWNMQFNAQGGGGFGVGNLSGTGKGEEKQPETPKLQQEETIADAFKNGTPWWDKMPSEFKLVPTFLTETPTDTSALTMTFDEIRRFVLGEDVSKLPMEPYKEKYEFNHPTESSGGIIQEILNEIKEGLIGVFTLWAAKPNVSPLEKRLDDKSYGKFQDFRSLSTTGNEPQAISFNLELTNKQTITLDGTVVAQAVSKYIGSELLRTARGGSFNKSVEVV